MPRARPRTRPTHHSRASLRVVTTLLSRRGPRRRPTGWTLVELTAAAALLLVALLAVVPLFIRAIRDVASGQSSSRASILAQNGLERLERPVPVDSTVPLEFFSLAEQIWEPEPPAEPDEVLWTRDGVVRYLGLPALEDGLIEDGELATEPAILAFVEVRIRSGFAADAAFVVERLERVAR